MTLTEALLITMLLGLGTARATAVISIDTISENLRDMIFHWFPPEDNDENGWSYQCLRKATADERKIAAGWGIPWWQKRFDVIDTTHQECRSPSFIGQLIACPKCLSVWIGAANLALYLVFPQAAILLNAFLAITFVAAVASAKIYQ